MLIGLAVLALGGWVIRARWDALVEAAVSVGLARLSIAFVSTVVAILASAESWHLWLRSLDRRVPGTTARRVFLLTQTSKYVPGAVWPLVTQGAASARLGLSAAALPTATALFLAAHVATGVVGGIGLVRHLPEWSALIVGSALLGGLMIVPPVTGRIARFVAGRNDGGSHEPTWRSTVVAVTPLVAMWVAYGAASHILLAPFGAGPRHFPLVLGASSIAWVVGFIALPVPAGIGLREGIYVALLAPTFGMTPALTAAILSRLLIVIGDVVLGTLSSGVVENLRSSEGPRRPPT